MDKWRCGAVVVARDEGRIIRMCLESLKGQTVELFVVVVYAFGRAVLVGLRHPIGGFALLRGYLSKVSEQYANLKNFVPSFQRRIAIKKIREVFRSWLG